MNRSVQAVTVLSALLLALISLPIHADTVIRKDGSELKGVLVEEHKDRFIISTADGEVPVMKADVRDLAIDGEEANLLYLAGKAVEAGDYAKATEYYESVLKIDPASEAAKKGMVRLRETSFQRAEAVKGKTIRPDYVDRYGSVPIVGKRGDEVEALTQRLFRALGLKLESATGCHRVSAVNRDSPAFGAGIRKGDCLVAVHGRLIRYMPLPEVMRLLLQEGNASVRCTIERTVNVGTAHRPLSFNAAAIIGATLYLGSDGMAVKDVREGAAAKEAGMANGDIVTAIGGAQTRYMPLAKADEVLRSSKGGPVELTIRRETVIWREARP